MALNQSKLTPQEQSLLFQLSQKAGLQPTAAGTDAVTPEAAADPHMDAFMAAATGGTPAETPATGPKLRYDPKTGGVRPELERGPSLMRLLGSKTKLGAPMPATNYAPAFLAQFPGATLPAGLPVGPDGQPFLTEETYGKLAGPEAASLRVAKSGQAEKPSMELGKAVLARAKSSLSPEEYAKAEEFVNANGGLQLSKLGEFNSAFLTARKEGDLFNTPMGAMYRDRSTGQVTPLVPPEQAPVVNQVLTKEGDRYMADPLIKKTRDLLSTIPRADMLLDTNSPAGRGALEGFLARVVAGEVGVMTDQDILRNQPSRAAVDRLMQFVKTQYNGKLTDANVGRAKELVDQVRKSAEMVLSANENAYARRAKTNLDRLGVKVDPAKLLDSIRLQAEYGTASTMAGQPGQTAAPQAAGPDYTTPAGIKDAFKKGLISRDQAKAMIKGL